MYTVGRDLLEDERRIVDEAAGCNLSPAWVVVEAVSHGDDGEAGCGDGGLGAATILR